MKKITAIAAAAALALALAGCVGIAKGSSPEAPPSAPGPDTLSAPSFAPPAEEEPAVPDTLAFGEAMTWEDGVSLSVGVPAGFTPSEYAAGGTLPHNVRFTVTVTNGSDAAFDGYTYASVTSGGAAGEQVFDMDNGLGGSPSGAILPGQTISFDMGFNVADPAAIVLQISPSFAYENVIFTNVAG